MACVNVCPMGIDIRNGQQLACITCALCIDACNDVMDKIGRPRDLIGYMALTDEAAERAGKPPIPVWKHIFRPRTILYTVLWAGIGIALVVALFIRTDMNVNVTPVRNPTFVTLSDGSVRNAYDFRIINKHGEARDFYLYIETDRSMRLSIEGTSELRVTVPANQTKTQRVYLTADRGSEAATEERSPVTFWVEDRVANERVSYANHFHGRAD
jgi:cytochrome c oxidase accessory protein FixG